MEAPEGGGEPPGPHVPGISGGAARGGPPSRPAPSHGQDQGGPDHPQHKGGAGPAALHNRRGMGSCCSRARVSMAARRSPSTGTPSRTRRDSRTALTTNQAAHSTTPRAVDQEGPVRPGGWGARRREGHGGQRAGRPQRGCCRRSSDPAPPGCAASPPRRSTSRTVGRPPKPAGTSSRRSKTSHTPYCHRGDSLSRRCAGESAGTGRPGRRLPSAGDPSRCFPYYTSISSSSLRSSSRSSLVREAERRKAAASFPAEPP